MNIEKFLSNFQDGSFSKVYFLKGEEEIFKNEFLQMVKRNVRYPEFNWTLYYGDELDSATLSDALFSLPFMSQLKIVAVKMVERLAPSILIQITKNAHRIPSTNCLILSGTQLPLKVEEAITKIGKVVPFKKPTLQQVKMWIKEKCREENKQIDNEAISLLIENTGRELSVTSQELGKLIIYVGENQQIEARDVEKVGIHTRSYTVFQLVDMISQKRTKNSINILRQLLTSGVTPQQIIGLLSWQFARLWKVKSLVSRGMAPYRALREVNIPSFSAKNFLLQVKNFSWEDLTKCFNLLLEADIQIKTGAEPNLTLELLILSFFK